MLNIKKKAAFGAAGAVALLGAGGTAWAVDAASTTASGPVPAAASLSVSATGSGTATTPSQNQAKRAKNLLSRADYATVEIRTKKGWETLDFDRGQVTASSTSSITLKRPDGTSVTEAITPSTKYAGPGTEALVGRRATVISLNGDALSVRQAAPKSSAPAGTGQPASPTVGAASATD